MPRTRSTGLPAPAWSRGGALLLVWGLLQSADLADAGLDLGRTLDAVPAVAGFTQFGHILLGQVMVVAAAAIIVRRWPAGALSLSAAALLLQAGHGHAWSMEDAPDMLLVAGPVHLLAAGAWLGGLLPLLIIVRRSTPRAGALAARWFSPLGKACVVGIVLSSAVQFWALIGGLPGLVGTAYGWVAGAKLGLLGALFAFAVANRYQLAPALLRATPDLARRRLARAIAVQTGFGLATVLAAGVLSNLPPAIHEQPAWPFSLRPSLAVMADADLASEVWIGAVLLAGAGAALLALLWRPMRRPIAATGAVLCAALLAWLAAPHLSLLLVEAYPTSYYTSPTAFAATSIVEGAALYLDHCARCHGVQGRGDGPDAAGLPTPPADLTAAHLWEHSDGELYWWLLHGIAAPDGTPAMPGTEGVLSDDQRWALIDAIRARNAGLAARGSDAWPQPVEVPEFSLTCPKRGILTTEDLRGRVLYLTAGPATPLPQGMRDAALPVVLTQRQGLDHPPVCASADPAAWDALAIVTGQPPDRLAGTRVLVGRDGTLHEYKTGSDAATWDDPGALAAAVAKSTSPAGSARHHHH